MPVTTERPTQSGWYWAYEPEWSMWMVVEVKSYSASPDDLWVVYSPAFARRVKDTHYTCWSGPLEEPQPCP